MKEINLNKLGLLKFTKFNKEEDSNNKNIKFNEVLKSIDQFKSIPENTNINYSQQINYKFISNNNLLFKKTHKLLLYSFYSMNSIISKPIFEITSEKVIIHLFFYSYKTNKNASNFLLNNKNKLNILCKILSRVFNKPVELELTRLYYPYFDSNIFVTMLNKLVNKIQVRNVIQNLFKKAMIINPNNHNNLIINKLPSFISGIKIKIGGRLLTDSVVPRKTTISMRKGTLSRNKINYLDLARYTSKNKRGAYSITITTGQYINKK
jgi:hypothetical protein